MTLLTQNAELKKDHIWNWTIPANNIRHYLKRQGRRTFSEMQKDG